MIKKSNLTALALKAPQLTGAVLKQTGADIADLASQLAPVDTGALRDSYRAENESETVVIVGSDKEYAPYVEFGTSTQSAAPHFTPAFKQAEETFTERLKQAINGS